eukprot:6620566-Alexandrium_andersonii.AAC.1
MTGWSTGISPWIHSCSASTRAWINPFSCLTAFSTALFAWGSYAGGNSSTVCTPSRLATAQRRSTNAGSLS